MKKLHILYLRSFIGPFIATFFISLFLFLLQALYQYVKYIVGKGLEWYVIVEFIFYLSIHLIPLALPLAILLSSIMTFGNLGERYELVAIKSSGISLYRSMFPLILLMVTLSVIAFHTANIWIPKANLNWGALFYSIKTKKPGMNLQEGIFFNDLEGYSIKVGKKHKDGETVEDILIYANQKNGINRDIITAKKGKLVFTNDKRFMVLTLEDGVRHQEMIEDKNYRISFPNNIMRFSYQKIAIDLTDLQFNRISKNAFKEDRRMLNVAELQDRIDSLNKKVKQEEMATNEYLQQFLDLPKLKDSISIQKNQKIDTLHALMKLPVSSKKYAKKNFVERNVKPAKPNNNDVFNFAISRARSIKNRLKIYKDGIREDKMLKWKYQVAYHQKFTLALSVILLFFIGASLGAIIRKGGFGLPLVVSILMFIVYHIINVLGEKLAKEGKLDPIEGMWMSTFILTPVAIMLTYAASKEIRFFEADFWLKLSTNLKTKVRKKIQVKN
ncbi:MAG: permease [Bacteroidetes bacterium MED-G17]|nr:MAG: permease [Bacteroidetes bacterium MED-G17]CAI8276080.1 MAG: Uncharacterised protein [Bacteroidetes bacterium MED-G17]